MARGHEVLEVAEMEQADRLTIEAGISGEDLMLAAGASVAQAILDRFAPCPVSVLCGPGGNGGDGFVVAHLLVQAGWPVRVGLFGDLDRLTGGTAQHARIWTEAHPVEAWSACLVEGAGLVVDAVFGAGLSRDMPAAVTDVLARARGITIVAVDVPSGVDGDSGADRGAVAADLTVTFFRKKPGHLLQPGRSLCGDLVVTQIGIGDAVLDQIGPATFENTPCLWQDALRIPAASGHKYSRGHALLWGGYPMTGAARLAAHAAARAGAGVVSIAVPPEAWAIYAASLQSVMVVPLSGPDVLAGMLGDPRLTALLIGPGAGHAAEIAAHTLAMLATGKPIVLDADIFTLFRDMPGRLLAAIKGPCVMTPHEGEFARIFELRGSKPERVRQAAVASRAVVVLKGSDTVIASPDGRCAINANAPPSLATAGAGDVLSGLITGLLAQGMPAFEAACAGVWMHGACATLFGPGLIADDIADCLPAVLRKLIA
jgi:NAD(P)H-hydrate epimerase